MKLEYHRESGSRIYGFQEITLTSYEQDYAENYIRRYASVIDYDEHVAYFDVRKEEPCDFLSVGLPFFNR